METLKKILAFFGLFFGYIVGSLAAIGYLLYLKEYFVVAFIAIVICMAFPTAKKWFRVLVPEVKPYDPSKK